MYIESSVVIMKLFKFFKRPRNLYFSIIVMLTVVAGLASISFSYYVGESTNETKLALSIVDNEIQSDALTDNKLTILPNETLTFNMFLISNNNFESIYKLFYKASDKVEVQVDRIYPSLEAHSVNIVKITVKNYSNNEEIVEIGIKSGYLNTNIDIEGKEIIR